jgi:hypothetical protein
MNEFKKHYLPAPVEGRFFRVKYRAENGIQRCLKLKLYGSPKGNEQCVCFLLSLAHFGRPVCVKLHYLVREFPRALLLIDVDHLRLF